MTHLVEFPLASGGSVFIEVADRPGGPVTRGLSASDISERAQETFEQALARVRPAVEEVIAQLRSLAQAPDEVRVEFGLDLHAQAGAFIASASTTANFTVGLTWRRRAAAAGE